MAGQEGITPLDMPLSEARRLNLREIVLQPVAAHEEGRFRTLMEAHHYLGALAKIGHTLWYVATWNGQWLALLSFSAAAWKCAARDVWIGWDFRHQYDRLHLLANNSRFLILPSIEVPNLGSHVLGLAARRVVVDWRRRYGYAPVLLETFVDEACFGGTVYKAANWQRLGESAGRGRQDRDNRAALGVKGIYVLPLQHEWRRVLCHRPAPVLRLAPASADSSWVEHEFGRVDFPDARLRARLLGLAQAFYEQPLAPIPMALHGDAGQSKAAYRFFHNPQVDLQTLLHPHYEATARRIAEHPLVLVVQDTTSLNYEAHPATRDLGPINTRADGAQGLKLHDSLALTPEGVPLGLIDIQVWARDPRAAGQARQR